MTADEFSEDEVRALLSSAVHAAGGQNKWAHEHQFGHAFVSDVLSGRRSVSARLAVALGLRRHAVFTRAEAGEKDNDIDWACQVITHAIEALDEKDRQIAELRAALRYAADTIEEQAMFSVVGGAIQSVAAKAREVIVRAVFAERAAEAGEEEP